VEERCKILNQSNPEPHYLSTNQNAKPTCIITQTRKKVLWKEEKTNIQHIEQSTKKENIYSHLESLLIIDTESYFYPQKNFQQKRRKYSHTKEKNDSDAFIEEDKVHTNLGIWF